MIITFIILLSIFFAINMGAPSFAGSFATAAGSKALSRKKAALLFIFFSLLGAIFLGGAVSQTISKGIIPNQLIDIDAVLIILTVATLSLFTANMMKIPQSTSLSTIAAICGVGTHYQSVHWLKVQHMATWWVILTVICFGLVYMSTRYLYPPKQRNFWVYEKILNNQKRLVWLVIISSCYKGFAQGSNNVANAVGPLMSAGILNQEMGLIIIGLFFGIGAFVFTGPMDTSSDKIVPLGLLTATVINVISGSVTIFASVLGLPLPTVIVYTVSIFAISTVKDGMSLTMANPVTQKTLFTWLINPIITFFLALLASMIFLNR